MISPLTITGLNQGKLYGEKPTIEKLDAHGAIIHEHELGNSARKLLAWKPLAWLDVFALFARSVRN